VFAIGSFIYLNAAEVSSLSRHPLLIWSAPVVADGGSEGPVKKISGNQCAQCGAVLIAPEWSEHFPDNRIRNVWSCEACGYEFENTVYWSRRVLVDAE
jgi:hypothetical protein